MHPTAPKPIVGAVLFEGFELLDLYGPLQIFGLNKDKLEVVTLGLRVGEVASNHGKAGSRGVIDQTFTDSPAVDVLLIPGGFGTRKKVDNATVLDAIRTTAGRATYVITVCTGSALLARTGLSDGKRATSNKQALKWVITQGPKVMWVPEARWVEDGKFFTASGVSAGLDATLALVAKIFGRERALSNAEGCEYEWHEDPTWDPFAKLAGLVP